MRESTPLDWHMNMEEAYEGREEERSREFRYTLAGQISTIPAEPPKGAENGQLEDSVYSDVDYRRALGPKTIPATQSPSEQASPSVAANAPGLGTWSLFSLQTIGDMVGKVWEFCKKGAFRGFQAGGGQKYSENGATVTETMGDPWVPERDATFHPVDESPMEQYAPSYSPQGAQSPLSPAYHDLSTLESTPLPAAKRRQVSANNDELRNWVVVDEPRNQPPRQFAAEVRAAAARPSGLARPRTGYYSQTSVSSHRRITTPSARFTGGPAFSVQSASRPSLRISHAGSPNLTPREAASFASPRSSPISSMTPSRIPVPVQQQPPQQSYNPNPFAIPGTTTITSATSTFKNTASRPASRPASRHTGRQSLGGNPNLNIRPSSPSKLGSHRRKHSSASVSSISAAATTTATSHSRRQSIVPKRPSDIEAISPRLDAEARQLAQRKLAAERDTDARVDAFNAQLLSMIRQGREALGTKVEVEMEMDDGIEIGLGGGGGWEDDD